MRSGCAYRPAIMDATNLAELYGSPLLDRVRIGARLDQGVNAWRRTPRSSPQPDLATEASTPAGSSSARCVLPLEARLRKRSTPTGTSA